MFHADDELIAPLVRGRNLLNNQESVSREIRYARDLTEAIEFAWGMRFTLMHKPVAGLLWRERRFEID
jgi:hypothetical protein